MAVDIKTATAGGGFTYVILSGTAQEVLDEMASRKQNKPTFKVLAMTSDGQSLIVLLEYSD